MVKYPDRFNLSSIILYCIYFIDFFYSLNFILFKIQSISIVVLLAITILDFRQFYRNWINNKFGDKIKFLMNLLFE